MTMSLKLATPVHVVVLWRYVVNSSVLPIGIGVSRVNCNIFFIQLP